jgi:hypothetical protein
MVGLLYHLYNQFAFNTLQRVSPVSHGVCNVVKRVVIIFSSVIFFNQVRGLWGGGPGCSRSVLRVQQPGSRPAARGERVAPVAPRQGLNPPAPARPPHRPPLHPPPPPPPRSSPSRRSSARSSPSSAPGCTPRRRRATRPRRRRPRPARAASPRPREARRRRGSAGASFRPRALAGAPRRRGRARGYPVCVAPPPPCTCFSLALATTRPGPELQCGRLHGHACPCPHASRARGPRCGRGCGRARGPWPHAPAHSGGGIDPAARTFPPVLHARPARRRAHY